MSYYIPAIPAVYFFMAMFGILIIFIEALIVLPIWTVMLCLTSGEEGWETAHMRQGVILLLGLMARLTGTVMVFFMVIVLLETAAPLFVALLFDAYLSIFSTSTAGPIGWLFMVGGVAIFAYQIIIRSFSLMTSLMDMIMQGLNLGHQTFGDQGDEDRGRSLVIAQMGRGGAVLGGLTKKPKTPTPGE
jgi:conjugal transfer/type IV secretion protein DotA/TraY